MNIKGTRSLFEVSTPECNSFIFTVVPSGTTRATKHCMTPFTVPYERRHFKRFDMTTRDCRLALMRVRGGKRERENCILCILTDLSYSGLRFQGISPNDKGEMLEFWLSIVSPLKRAGLLRGRVCWARPADSQWYDCGVELLGESKGLLGPDEEWPSMPDESK